MPNFVYISKDRKEEFFKYKDKHPSIKCCDVYVDKESDRIYFVEKGLHGGAFELIHDEMPNWKGQRNQLKIYDDYAGDAILSDSCKAINAIGLS